jgi:hypothetical protein
MRRKPQFEWPGTFCRTLAALTAKAALLLVVLCLCGGCAARRAPLAQPYRLLGIGGADFLLPPDFSPKEKQAVTTEVLLGELSKGRPAGQQPGCSIRGRWFSLIRDKKSNGWVAALPAPDAWHSNDFVADIREEWGRFSDEIYDLDSEGCIGPEGYEKATDWIRQSMPAPAQLASFFRDPLNDRGFVALRPDTRLFIERSLFRPPGAETVANYAGEMKVYYSIAQERGGEIGLKLHKIRRSAHLPRKLQEVVPDATLAHHFGRAGAIRLFLLTRYIPPNLKRTALLIGVQNPADMVAVSRKIEKQPKIPCNNLAEAGIACASFDGEVSASVELGVTVNGKEKFVPLGSTVNSILTSLSPNERAEALATLNLRRIFHGKLHSVEFHRNDPEVPKLALVAGDRISWRAKPSSP